MFLMSSSKNGVAAKELERQLGVTYKTAWRMAHQIRKLMDSPAGLLSGIVEADETYVGGKARNMHANTRKAKGIKTGTSSKVAVIGVLERGGSVQAKVVYDVKMETVVPNIVDNVAEGSTICTDELTSYNPLFHRCIYRRPGSGF